MSETLESIPFEDLESLIESHIEKFENYTTIFNPNADHPKFLQNTANLRVIIKSKKGTLSDCKTDLSEILLYITTFYDNELLLKAKDYIISSIKMIEQDDAAVFSAINDKSKNIKNIMHSNNEIRNKPLKTVGDVEAVLNLHTRETESMQYPLIQSVKNYLPSNIDLYNLLSIIGKVRKGNYYRTDSTAIRDCISHDKVEIKEGKIIFDNHDEGYDFHLEFTYKKFQDFMGRKGKLYALLFDSNNFLYLENLLKIYFNRKKTVRK